MKEKVRIHSRFTSFLLCVFVVALVPVLVYSQKSDIQREVIYMDAGGDRGVVIFDHRKHAAFRNPDPSFPHKTSADVSCIGCHHTVTNVLERSQFQRCTDCHAEEGNPKNPADADGIDLNAREIFHRSCIGCHVASNVVASNERLRQASFTRCQECHDPVSVYAIVPEQPEPRAAERPLPSAPLRAQPSQVQIPQDRPLGFAGRSPVSMPTEGSPDYMVITDRWRIGFPDDPRYRKGSALNPYRQNILKADYPILGQQTFLNLMIESDSYVNARKLPVPSDVSSQRPESSEFFGRGEQVFPKQTFFVSADLFHGDTAYKPIDWRILIAPAINVNYLYTRENGIVDIDVRRGNTRTDYYLTLQQAFGEVRLFSTEPFYDTSSARFGIQPFISDFRGMIFYDVNLGARLFGNFRNNRYQYNVAFFDMLEKDTNSELNTMEWRDQRVAIANFYRQDFLTKGYNIQLSYHFNQDKPGLHTGEEMHIDKNGFLVRPAQLGTVSPHEIKAHYAGFTSEGHIGRLNVSHSYYYAFGNDERNTIARREVDIRAHLAALELSVDKDWLRYRGSVFFSSGDGDPYDENATGFDAIFDAPEFSGGKFSFWNSQGIRLTQTGVALVNPDSLLPSLRSSKTEGQANFVNPGLFIYNVGLEAELTPKLRGILNANYLHFHKTETLREVLFQEGIGKDIGLDLGVGFLYRPLLSENFIIAAGFSTLLPGGGLRDIYSSNCSGQGCGADAENLYSAFVRVKLVY